MKENIMISIKEYITFENILKINELCLLKGEPFAVVDKNRICSALGNQVQPYPSQEQAFASMYRSLVINHGFLNGNKRTGVIALYIASKLIDNPLKINDKDLCELTYKIAGEGGSQILVEDIANMVFKYKSSDKQLSNNLDLETLVREYIEKHDWLIKELAK